MNKTLDLEKIKSVTTIVTHDNCSDGLASAILLHDVLPEAEIVFCQHGSESYEKLEVRPNTLFVDIVPFAEMLPAESSSDQEISPDGKKRIQEWVKAGAVVLDHHKGAKKIVEMFGSNAVFGDEKLNPGVSGAPLAYKHVWKPLRTLQRETDREVEYDSLWEEWADEYEQFVARFAERAGIRDTWQRANPEWYESTLQGEVLYFWPREFWLSTPLSEVKRHWETQFHPVGSILMKKHAESMQRVVENAKRFVSTRGTRVVCFNNVRASSDVAENLDKDVDLVVGFTYRCEHRDSNVEPKLILSTRSHTFYDCIAFTKWYGGGGHTKAAGTSIKLDPKDPNAYAHVERLVNEFEEKNPSKARLKPCATCGKSGHLPQDHAGWNPTEESRG